MLVKHLEPTRYLHPHILPPLLQLLLVRFLAGSGGGRDGPTGLGEGFRCVEPLEEELRVERAGERRRNEHRWWELLRLSVGGGGAGGGGRKSGGRSRRREARHRVARAEGVGLALVEGFDGFGDELG